MRKLALFALLTIAALGVSQEMKAKEMLVSKKIFLALQEDVKTELKVSDDQLQKIKDVFGDALRIEDNKVMIMVTDGQDINKMAEEAIKPLNPEQTKRLKEIWVQSLNGVALADEEVAKEIKLTDDQNKSIDKLVESAAQELHSLFSGGNVDDAAIKKAKQIRADVGKKMVELLTEDQKKQYEAMKGKEFKFKTPVG